MSSRLIRFYCLYVENLAERAIFQADYTTVFLLWMRDRILQQAGALLFGFHSSLVKRNSPGIHVDAERKMCYYTFCSVFESWFSIDSWIHLFGKAANPLHHPGSKTSYAGVAQLVEQLIRNQ